MCRKIIAVAGRTANNQRLQGAIVFPNPNYSTTESGKVCELGFPEKTPSGFPLVIITPIGKNVSVIRQDPPVCTASVPGACSVGYELSTPAQVYFVADVLGGHF